MRDQEEISNLQNVISQMRARSVFGQHDLLIGHNVDLKLTLQFLSGPVPWLLTTPDRISTKTDKSKLLHGLQSYIEQTLDWPCSAAHNFDCNAILQSIIAFPVNFKDLMEPSTIQPDTKGRTCWFCH